MIGAGPTIVGVGTTYPGSFNTVNSVGALANADSLPTGTLVIFGSDTGVTVTITNVATGRYSVSVSLAGRSVGEVGWVRINATVGSVVQEDRLPGFVVAFPAALSGGILTVGSGTAQFNVSGGKGPATVASGDDVDSANIKATIGLAGAGLTGVQYNGPSASTVATAVEQQIMDETDTRQVLQAIVDKINAADPSLAGLTTSAIAQAVRDVLLSGAAANSLGEAVSAIKAKTTNLPTDPTSETNATTNKTAILSGVSTAVGSPMQAGTKVVLNVAQTDYAPAKAGDAMTLTSGERNTVASVTAGQVTTDHGSGSYVTQSGGGAYVYTVTVTSDGTTPVDGARVRLGDFERTSDSLGQAVFSANADVYSLSATKFGYDFTPISVTVSGNGARTITLTTLPGLTTPPDLTQTTAYLTVRGGSGLPIQGVVVEFQMKDPDASTDAWLRKTFSARSGSSGVVQQPLARLRTYRARVDGGAWEEFTTTDTTTYALPELLGAIP